MTALFQRGDEVPASALANKFCRHIPAITTGLYNRLVAQGYFDASPLAVRGRLQRAASEPRLAFEALLPYAMAPGMVASPRSSSGSGGGGSSGGGGGGGSW